MEIGKLCGRRRPERNEHILVIPCLTCHGFVDVSRTKDALAEECLKAFSDGGEKVMFAFQLTGYYIHSSYTDILFLEGWAWVGGRFKWASRSRTQWLSKGICIEVSIGKETDLQTRVRDP